MKVGGSEVQVVVMAMTRRVPRSPAWLPGSKAWLWIWGAESEGFKGGSQAGMMQ